MIYIHRLRPEILQITDTIAVRWYGLSYLAGFLTAYFLLRSFARRNLLRMSPAAVQDFLTVLAIFGVMLGGRLGYFLFYHPGDLLGDPLRFFRLWEGGMASHGGMIGCALVVRWWSKKHRISFLNLMDNLVVSATPGLALGRLANFINGELWGRPTGGGHGVVFPLELPEFNPGGRLAAQRYDLDVLQTFVDNGWLEPRHPSQLYQALGEGLLLFALLYVLRTHAWSRVRGGRLTLVFLLGYGAARFTVEFFREPDAGVALLFGWMSRGQLLTLFMFATAAALWLWGKTSPKPS